jgi:hypothetical protein
LFLLPLDSYMFMHFVQLTRWHSLREFLCFSTENKIYSHLSILNIFVTTSVELNTIYLRLKLIIFIRMIYITICK